MCCILDPIIYYAIPQSTQTKEKLKIPKLTFKLSDTSVSKDVQLDVRNQSLPGKCLAYVFSPNFT